MTLIAVDLTFAIALEHHYLDFVRLSQDELGSREAVEAAARVTNQSRLFSNNYRPQVWGFTCLHCPRESLDQYSGSHTVVV